MTTGKRGDRIVIDDPHDIGEVGRAVLHTTFWDRITRGMGTCDVVQQADGPTVVERVAVVSGSSTDAIAHRLATLGAEVVVFGQGNGQLAEAVAGWDLASAPDVTHYRWVPRLDDRTRRTHEEFGRLFPRPTFDELADMPPPVHLGMFNCRGDYVWPGMTDEERRANRKRGTDPWRDLYQNRPLPSDTPPRAHDLPAEPVSKRRARRLRGRGRP